MASNRCTNCRATVSPELCFTHFFLKINLFLNETKKIKHPTKSAAIFALYSKAVYVKLTKVKYVDLCSASSRNASNALPLPVSRRWSPQANFTARHSANTARQRIQVGVSRNMPVYSPSLRRILIPACGGSGWVGLGAWFRAEVVYSSKDDHPVRH